MVTSGVVHGLSPGTNQADTFTWEWIVVGLVFLIVLLCLFYLLRERRAMSRTVSTQRSDLMVLFDQAPCGYHSVDEQGTIIDINNTLLSWLHYSRNEIVGKLKFSNLVVREGDVVSEKFAALMAGKTSGTIDLEFVTKTGETLPVILKELSDPGDNKRLFSTLNNKECHEALQRIEHLDQELESFSYSISHDLRAPLRSIDGYSRILQEDYGGQLGDDGQRVMNVIMNNARRMGNLIDDLLDFGRLGRKSLQRSLLDMNALVEDIVHELQSNATGRQVEVSVGTLQNVPADPDMMRQVWFNLLDNAFKFTAKNDVVRIEVRSFQQGNTVCYEVKDNGVGFDMKYASKLFGVFQRLHKIQDFKGTGVGLAIVKRVVSRHGGHVWAEASLEKGAAFYFTIPLENENT